MTNGNRRTDDSRPLADRRAQGDGAEPGTAGPEDYDEADFAEEHAPSPTDPPIAGADGPGGQDEGYEPQTRA